MVEVPQKDWSKKLPKYLDADPCFIRMAQYSQTQFRNLRRVHFCTDFQPFAVFKKEGGFLKKNKKIIWHFYWLFQLETQHNTAQN